MICQVVSLERCVVFVDGTGTVICFSRVVLLPLCKATWNFFGDLRRAAGRMIVFCAGLMAAIPSLRTTPYRRCHRVRPSVPTVLSIEFTDICSALLSDKWCVSRSVLFICSSHSRVVSIKVWGWIKSFNCYKNCDYFDKRRICLKNVWYMLFSSVMLDYFRRSQIYVNIEHAYYRPYGRP